jgi:hypothetical protein
MSRIKVSENFFLDEFIDPVTYAELGAKSIDRISRKLIAIAQFIRTKTGKTIVINNWIAGGRFKESGLRQADTKTGSKLSQHKIGQAIDLKQLNVSGKDWHKFVEENAKELFRLGVRRIECDKLAATWLHIDLKEHNKQCIQVVDLTKVIKEIPLK